MELREQNQNLIVRDVKDFLLSHTLECGQCFHYVKINQEEYGIVSGYRYLHVKQEKDTLIFYDTTKEEYEAYWEYYFDLQRDYGKIKEILLEKDSILKEPVSELWGMRILNQDFFETMISFIISQNQQIPRIKGIIANLSRAYGEEAQQGLFTFPDASALQEAGVEGIRSCKAGFRSPYILDACDKYLQGSLKREVLVSMDYAEAMKALREVRGIGEKVANCILLFSLGKRNAFPVDVWIKRVVETLYFQEEVSIPKINELAREKFGEYGGYAQQYLFYAGISKGIGKK